MLETTVAVNARTTVDLPVPDDWPVPLWSPAVGPVSVVIPAMNEERNISWVLGRMPAGVAEVILVDGRSVDSTVSVARAARPDIVVVSEPRRGKGRALRAGFEVATGDAVVMLDADGSMDPQEIGWFVTPLQHEFDFVKGSRYVTGGGSEDITLLRSAGNRALTRLANVVLHSNYSDLCYGYIAMRRECLQILELQSEGFEIETELIVRASRAGLRIAEVPSNELNRISGNSNLHTFRDGWRVLRTLARECVGWEAPTAGARPEALRRVKYRYPSRSLPHIPTDPATVLGLMAGD